MNFRQQKQIEKLFPSTDHWEWLEGTRYRIKQLKNSAWYGLQIFASGDQFKAKPVFVFKGNRVELIQTNIPFLSTKDAIDHFEKAKNKVIELADTSTRCLKIRCSEIVNIRA
jgi:hypothetical protein